ncbi:hypothetical protein BDF22DRAFT_682127 [Syncephalis plumigaleata]|nr:hypothetical protein BDF22DRAFT_682127 [Syncephalis plumigaleata]
MKSSIILAVLGCVASIGLVDAYKNTLFQCVLEDYCQSNDAQFVNCISQFDQTSQAILDKHYKRLFSKPTILGLDHKSFCNNPALIEKTFDEFTNEVAQGLSGSNREERFNKGVQCLRSSVPNCKNRATFGN